MFDLNAFQQQLTTGFLGRNIVYRPVIASTNTLARELVEQDAATGTLVLTDEQPQGRGRVGRTWYCQPGRDILMSLIMRPAYPPQFLMMATAVAVIAALRVVASITATIKWPNDILIAERKVAGILLETGYDARNQLCAIVGVGINVNGTFRENPELAPSSTTVLEAVGHPVSREQLLAAFLAELEKRSIELDTGTTAAQYAVQREWRQSLSTIGRVVRVQQSTRTIQGIAIETNRDGWLSIQQPNGEVACITWGDIITDVPQTLV
jgi:BirA family biotin operon repressor/biotin-[acetyl-CoA-carboxylase] ligase